ncbi:hypothetical protein Pcinc_026693 [Petrolisthes cinctipes]|uniref:Glypican n=1 Tax=Petrolisthes cinctipes TaxID=88211 RepID=A0AAE1K9Q2_PETCI|nr:hypothetical protein Pcinc_026693 [Petrolisthes cinctipes]
MERKLSVKSRQEYDNKLKDILNPIASLLAKKNTKLNEVFRKLLNHSRVNFHAMFSKTYGILYQQNSDVFVKLYDELDKYFKTGELDLQDTMDNFFRLLYKRMFRVMNVQYTFSPRYLQCVTQHMEELQPFKDVPKKLTTQIKRSFVALRTFVQGLATGRDVVRNVLRVNPSASCVHELMRMNQCSTCAGEPRVQLCRPYCHEVINYCHSHHQPLIAHWIAYVDAMVSVADRLENPFNFENVVQPVNYKVSEAIMNFQESGVEISDKVFKGCGQPPLGRTKRQAVEGEINQDFLDFRGDHIERRGEREQETISVSRHVHEIKTKIRNARAFWSDLDKKMCEDTAREGSTSCWTGTQVGKYESKGGFNITDPHHSSEMNEQVMRLKIITSKLQEAYNGRDVSWIDDESWLGSGGRQREQAVSDAEAEHEEEGSGSGDGDNYSSGSSGHLPIDDEDAYTPKNKHHPYSGYDDDEEEVYPPYSHGSGHDERYGRGHDLDGNEGSGWDMEGSGDDFIHRSVAPVNTNANTPTDIHKTQTTNRNIPKQDTEQPPSAATKESMSLNRAITIYMLPAFIMFLGSLA